MKIEGIHAISATDVLPQPPPAVFRVKGLYLNYLPSIYLDEKYIGSLSINKPYPNYVQSHVPWQRQK